jgi:hypothetical protein
MTQFTITLPKQSIDPKGSLKSRILQAAAKKLPFAKWHGIDTPSNPLFDVEYAGPKDKLCFGLNSNAGFSALNKRFWDNKKEDVYYIPFLANKSSKPKNYNAFDQLDLALKRLQEYADFLEDKERDPGYDFLYFGQPVRVYQKFIQVGNDIIPTSDLNFFKREEQTPIINLIVNISNSETITNILANIED